MKISTREDNRHGITIVDLVGRLTIGEGDVQLRQGIENVLADGSTKILINLEGIKMMDSSGLGELVAVRSRAARAGATVKLLHVEDKVHEVLEMTRLIGVFDPFDDEIDALNSFGD